MMSASAAQAEIEIVTVTAEKRTEDIQNVPISMHAFSSSQIRERGLGSVADLANQVPGLEMGELGAAANISMRGIGLSTLSGDGEGSVAINLDGVYIAQSLAAVMLQNDLGNVEVLSGPQSTLYGKNAIAGVINYATPSPTSEFEAGVRASAGDYGEYSIAGSISGPISDNAQGRLFIGHDSHNGYIHNLTNGQATDFLNGTGGDAAIDANLSNNVSVQLRAHVRKEIFGGPVYDPYDPNYLPLFLPNTPFVLDNLVAIDPQQTRGTIRDHADRGLYGGSAKVTVALGGADLISITGYNQFNINRHGDGLHIDAVTVDEQRSETYNTLTQELDLRSRDSKLQWLLGAYFLDGTSRISSLTSLPGSFVDTSVKSQSYNYSLFADLQYPVLDHTRIYGGARIFSESETYGITSAVNGFSPCDINTPFKRSTTDWAGRAGIQQDVTDGVMVYAQYSRGYKSGGFGSATCGNEYAPEKNNAYELGLKSAWFDNRLIVNAAYYHYDYGNLQIETDVPTGLLFVNAPRAQVDGGEVNIQAEPIDKLDLNLGLSLLDARYTEFLAQNVQLIVIGLETPGASLAGNPLNRAPSYVVNIGAQYTMPLPNDWGSLTARGEAKFSDKFALSEADVPATTQPAYTMANFYLTYTDPSDKYSVRGYVKNATNAHVLGGVLSFYGLEGSFGAPRTFGVEVTAALQ